MGYCMEPSGEDQPVSDEKSEYDKPPRPKWPRPAFKQHTVPHCAQGEVSPLAYSCVRVLSRGTVRGRPENVSNVSFAKGRFSLLLT